MCVFVCERERERERNRENENHGERNGGVNPVSEVDPEGTKGDITPPLALEDRSGWPPVAA